MAKTLDEIGVKRLIQEIKGANKNLNIPIPISTENTPESMAQNVKNIADYVEKAKAAGVDTTKPFRVSVFINTYPAEGTCHLDSEYIYCLTITDDNLVYYYTINTQDGEVELSSELLSYDIVNAITSTMLNRGARKPIILTPSTTEVDEETYQKLLSDNVDVVFKSADDNLCILTYKVDKDVSWRLVFTCFSGEGSSIADLFLYAYTVDIVKNGIHKCTIETNFDAQSLEDILNSQNYLVQSTLSPVLQEIDLTGTEADRKAKLDKFETDWKDLTGASDLTGARFVGLIDAGDYGFVTALLTFDYNMGVWEGIGNRDDSKQCRVQVDPTGTLHITPLFSHLEPVTIYTDNTPEHMQANLDNIAAYEANSQALGVDTSKGIIIPTKAGDYIGWLSYNNDVYSGIYTGDDFATQYVMSVDSEGRFSDVFIPTENDLLEYKSLNAKSLEAITIKTGNTANDKAANVAAIKAYVDNLKLLGVDTTKGHMIPIRTSLEEVLVGFIIPNMTGTGYVGLGSIANGNGTNLYISNEGNVSMYRLQDKNDNNLATTKKNIVSAINEVNALAQGVKAFGAIELKASDDAANKTALAAYLKILTDAQVDTTNGYSVPVRITGNAQEYHGMLNIGTGVLLSGIVTDVNENHHYPFNVSTTDGAILFDENNYFLEKGSNEVTEMLDAIKYSYTAVPFTDTTLSNKAQLEVFLSKVPNATVMHCTYKEIWAGTLHKINGDWYGLLVKNTNSPADNINVKLSADGTIVTSNSAQ